MGRQWYRPDPYAAIVMVGAPARSSAQHLRSDHGGGLPRPAAHRGRRNDRVAEQGAYLAGTNTRRVSRDLASLFGGVVSKSTVSRVRRKIKADWEAWNTRDLANEDVVRPILHGTVVRVRLDRKSTSITLLVVLGVRRDGQKVLLAVKGMGGESEAAWRAILDDLTGRGLRKPEFAIDPTRYFLLGCGESCRSLVTMNRMDHNNHENKPQSHRTNP